MLHILHLEDSENDAFFAKRMLSSHAVHAEITVARNESQFRFALSQTAFDVALVDNSVPGFSGIEAIRLVREHTPDVPVICVSGSAMEERALASLQAGASAYVPKDELWQLIGILRAEEQKRQLRRRNQTMVRLVSAIQSLSLTHDLEGIMDVVRRAARELTGADGATFVLREGEFCYYAEEDAIAPLWKGQRFPLEACISGWTMLHRIPAVIEDIYRDPRIPADAYRPTFVKSLVMVPIRTAQPIGAIGNYWATQRLPAKEEVELLEALANTTAVAMENVKIYAELEQRVKERTAQLEHANRELETFSYAVSHDLANPLNRVRSYANLLLQEQNEKLDNDAKEWIGKIHDASLQMGGLIKDLLRLSKFSKSTLRQENVNLSELAGQILSRLIAGEHARKVEVRVAPGVVAHADKGLMGAALENLLSNAWKYTAKTENAIIEFGATDQEDGSQVIFVRDNGAGFDMRHAHLLFQPFQRLHSESDFSGTGVGLATVQRIIVRHGGRIWAESHIGRGATFYFTLPRRH